MCAAPSPFRCVSRYLSSSDVGMGGKIDELLLFVDDAVEERKEPMTRALSSSPGSSDSQPRASSPLPCESKKRRGKRKYVRRKRQVLFTPVKNGSGGGMALFHRDDDDPFSKMRLKSMYRQYRDEDFSDKTYPPYELHVKEKGALEYRRRKTIEALKNGKNNDKKTAHCTGFINSPSKRDASIHQCASTALKKMLEYAYKRGGHVGAWIATPMGDGRIQILRSSNMDRGREEEMFQSPETIVVEFGLDQAHTCAADRAALPRPGMWPDPSYEWTPGGKAIPAQYVSSTEIHRDPAFPPRICWVRQPPPLPKTSDDKTREVQKETLKDLQNMLKFPLPRQVWEVRRCDTPGDPYNFLVAYGQTIRYLFCVAKKNWLRPWVEYEFAKFTREIAEMNHLDVLDVQYRIRLPYFSNREELNTFYLAVEDQHWYQSTRRETWTEDLFAGDRQAWPMERNVHVPGAREDIDGNKANNNNNNNGEMIAFSSPRPGIACNDDDDHRHHSQPLLRVLQNNTLDDEQKCMWMCRMDEENMNDLGI